MLKLYVVKIKMILDGCAAVTLSTCSSYCDGGILEQLCERHVYKDVWSTAASKEVLESVGNGSLQLYSSCFEFQAFGHFSSRQ